MYLVGTQKINQVLPVIENGKIMLVNEDFNVNEKNKNDVQWLNKCLETMKKIDNELKMLIDQIR